MTDKLKERIIREEGWKNELYQDTKGIWTIGVGYNIEEKGLPNYIIDQLLRTTLSEAWEEARSVVTNWYRLNYARRSVLVAMVFQMGLSRTLGFKRMIAAVEAEDFDTAADEMLDSKWAREDSPARAEREADIMREGKLP